MKRIMALYIFFLLLISWTGMCFAHDNNDDRNKIAFQLKPFNISDNSFYIKEIIDGRKDKSNVGYMHEWGSHKDPVVLWGDLRSDLQALADISFKKDENKIPIVFKVNILRLSEWHGLHQYVKVEAKVVFYREKDGKLGKVYETEAFIEKQDQIFKDNYELVIREVLEKCLQSFVVSGWASINPTWEEYQKVANSNQDTSDALSLVMPDRRKIVLIEPLDFSTDLSGAGLLQYEYDANQTGWVRVDNSTTEVFSVKDGGDTRMIYNFGSRTGVMKRFGESGFAFLIEGGIPLGVEKSSGHYNPFIGLNLQENIVYFPLVKNGLVVTAGFYQIKLFYTDLYSWDNGVKASIGYQF